MLVYKAKYRFLDVGGHVEVLDFAGAITWGTDLENARQSLASALVEMAETNLERGESLPVADPTRTDPESDIEEPVALRRSDRQRD